jgi:hypothetical protein
MTATRVRIPWSRNGPAQSCARGCPRHAREDGDVAKLTVPTKASPAAARTAAAGEMVVTSSATSSGPVMKMTSCIVDSSA